MPSVLTKQMTKMLQYVQQEQQEQEQEQQPFYGHYMGQTTSAGIHS